MSVFRRAHLHVEVYSGFRILHIGNVVRASVSVMYGKKMEIQTQQACCAAAAAAEAAVRQSKATAKPKQHSSSSKQQSKVT